MKFTLNWLKDHLDTQASLEDIVDALTRVGLEVEGVEDPRAVLAPYKVVHVISAEQHPNADRLRVCMVDQGDGKAIQVVCGAPNARGGMKSVFSPPGTFIPGKNITLGVGTIRGVESAGMLCSAFELGLSNDHDGIIDLPADAPIGMAYADYAGLDDPVIDVAITPNRSDALSVYGIARDLAAAGLGTLKRKIIAEIPAQESCAVSVSLDFTDADQHLVPAFALRRIRGVKNGPSPDWMQRRLKAIGLRPINALVDMTNYLTFDFGRPLHVFDAAKVHGALHVRFAREGETIHALDGKTHALQPGMVVIADDKNVESIAGIMGGEQSGCDDKTTDVLIESALWDPLNIAQSGRKLGINTDARYRFERGVDPAFCLPGLQYATQLVLDLCGGTPSEIVLAGKIPQPEHRVSFPLTEVERLTGLHVEPAQQCSILENLGFMVSGSGTSREVRVPSWRPDIEGKADLVEEVVRIVGIDHVLPVPFQRQPQTVAKPVLTLIQKRTRLARRALAARGMVEAVTWSFISHEEARLFGGGSEALVLANPIAADLSTMRPSLLPGLIKAAQRNANRGFPDTALFEVGQVFAGDQPDDQTTHATALRRADARPHYPGRHWASSHTPVDFYDVKADVMALLETLAIPTGGLMITQGGPSYMHPGRSATLKFGPKAVIGCFGELHPRCLEALDAKGPLIGFEVCLDLLLAPKNKTTRMKAKLQLSDFQPVERDFAFVVEESVPAGDVLKAAQAADRQLIQDVTLFDIYRGQGIEAGHKSLAINVTLQPFDKTLTDADIDTLAQKIIAEVKKKTGAQLRL